jgi:hypothetical protein
MYKLPDIVQNQVCEIHSRVGWGHNRGNHFTYDYTGKMFLKILRAIEPNILKVKCKFLDIVDSRS